MSVITYGRVTEKEPERRTGKTRGGSVKALLAIGRKKGTLLVWVSHGRYLAKDLCACSIFVK